LMDGWIDHWIAEWIVEWVDSLWTLGCMNGWIFSKKKNRTNEKYLEL